MTAQCDARDVGETLAEGMLDVKGCVEFSKLSRAELYAAMARGELRFFNYGRRRLIAKRDLISWLGSRLVPSGND